MINCCGVIDDGYTTIDPIQLQLRAYSLNIFFPSSRTVLEPKDLLKPTFLSNLVMVTVTIIVIFRF